MAIIVDNRWRKLIWRIKGLRITFGIWFLQYKESRRKSILLSVSEPLSFSEII